jgi:hypothetical protein
MGVPLTVPQEEKQRQEIIDGTDELATLQLELEALDPNKKSLMFLIVDLMSIVESVRNSVLFREDTDRTERREVNFRRGARTILVDDTMHAFKITAKEHAFTRVKPQPILKQNKPLPYKHQTNNQKRQLYGASTKRRTKGKK